MSVEVRGGIIAAVVMFALTAIVPNVFALGVKELEAEKSAVTFAREVVRGGYGIVTTDELKKWIDERKSMLIVDTMPFEASYKKNHIPNARQMEFPIPEMNSLDDKTRSDL